MDINTNTMSLKDLKDLQSQVARAIGSFEDRHKKAALAELEEFARAKGYDLALLTGTTIPRKRAPAAPKYANPANKSDTWSGRGRKPRWFLEALAKGRKPEDLGV